MNSQDHHNDARELSEVEACKGLVNYPKAKCKITKLSRPPLRSLPAAATATSRNSSPLPCPREEEYWHGLSKCQLEQQDGCEDSTPPTSNQSVFGRSERVVFCARSENSSHRSGFYDDYGTSSVCCYEKDVSVLHMEQQKAHLADDMRRKYARAIPHFKAIPLPVVNKPEPEEDVLLDDYSESPWYLALQNQQPQSRASRIAPPPPSLRARTDSSGSSIIQIQTKHHSSSSTTWRGPSELSSVSSQDSLAGGSSCFLDTASHVGSRQTTLWESSEEEEGEEDYEEEAPPTRRVATEPKLARIVRQRTAATRPNHLLKQMQSTSTVLTRPQKPSILGVLMACVGKKMKNSRPKTATTLGMKKDKKTIFGWKRTGPSVGPF